MADPSSDRYVLLNQLADEFAERYRRGERPPLQEYCDRHPELADDIREFFPAMVQIEQVKDDVQAPDVVVPPPPLPIECLGDFHILREIGHGGMGTVYEAEQLSLGRRVALKLLTQRLLRDANQKRRFEREAKSAAKLHHTNIVPVFGFGEHEGTPYYVMQFIQGTGLDVVVEEVARLEGGESGTPASLSQNVPAAVARSLVTGVFQDSDDEKEDVNGLTAPFVVSAAGEPRPSEPPKNVLTTGTHAMGVFTDTSGVTSSVTLPGQSGIGSGRKARKLTYWQGVARIGVQVADALDYAHKQGIIHRDVKPSNLLLDMTGTTWVTDFGLAKADGAENLTHTGDVLGTLRYMPPEAFDGKADARSDIYSLGLTLYELLALRPAFHEHDRNKLIKQVTSEEPARLRKVRRGVPRDLETIIHKAIDREPSQRYQSSGELAADLQRFMDDEPIAARRQTAGEAAWRWARHHKAIAAMLATLAILLVAITLASVSLAAYFRQQGIVQRDLVREKTALADDKTALADRNQKLADDNKQALRQVETTLCDMQVSRGMLANERDDNGLAVLWFARAAQQAESDPQRQADNRLRAKNWARDLVLPVGAFSVGQAAKRMVFRPGDDLLLIETNGRFYVWDWRQEKPLSWADGSQPIAAACWSPDGAALAVAQPTGLVQIRSVPDGTVLQTLSHPPTTALAYSPDGRYLAVGNNVVKLWDTRAGAFLKVQWSHPQLVDAMAFNAKGDRLVTACRDKLARVFTVSADSPNQSQLFGFTHSPREPSPPAFIDYGGHPSLATIMGPPFAGDNQLWLWNIETAKAVSALKITTKPTQLERVAASTRGNWLVTGGIDCAEVWNTSATTMKSIVLDHLNRTRDFAFDPEGTTLLTVSDDHTARLWSLPEGRPIGSPLAHMGDVNSCAFSGNGKYFATARTDGQVRIWKRSTHDLIHVYEQDWGRRVRVSPNGLLLAPGEWHESPFAYSGIGFNRFVVLDATNGKPAGPAVPLAGKLIDSCVCADNQSVAAISLDGTLSVWDVATGRAVFEARKLPSRPESVAARPGESQVAVLCQQGELFVFDSRSGERILDLGHDGWRNNLQHWPRVEYTPDGGTLITLTGDGEKLHIRDASTGQLRYPPICPILQKGPCRGFAISTDSRLLATAVNGKNAAQVWDLATGQALSEPLLLPGDFFGIFHLCFTPDGRYLLTGSKDGLAHLWDWKAGTLACPPLKHTDEVYAVAMTVDGRYALTASRGKSGGIHVWELTTGKLVAPPLRLSGSVQTLALSPDGARLFVCSGNSVSRIDLSELIAPPAEKTEDLELLGELTSARRIEQGDVSNLTMEQWRNRWSRFRQKHPEFDRPNLAEAIARANAQSQKARTLIDANRGVEAMAAWQQAFVEIDRATGTESERRAIRTEIWKEARTFLENLLARKPENVAAVNALATLLLESWQLEEWTVLVPDGMKTTNGTTLTKLPDNSILASGSNPANDTYIVDARTSLRGITGLRLEAITDPSLPHGGPGHDPIRGNFCLTEISWAFSTIASKQLRQMPFVRAAASYRRPIDIDTSARDGPHGAIDGSHETRWDVWPRVGQSSWAVFETAKPFDGDDSTTISIQLDFQHLKHKLKTLGRFRLSVTNRPNCVRAEHLTVQTTHMSGMLRLATVYAIRGEWDLALAASQKLTSMKGAGVEPYNNLIAALIYEQLGRRAEADKELDSILKLPVISPDAITLELTVELCSARLARDPKNAICLMLRSRWHASLGRDTEAADDLRRALEFEPELALRTEYLDTLVAIGNAAIARGEWPLAATIYTHLVNLNPADHWIWYRAAIIQAFVGNTQEYRRVCEGMLKKFGATGDAKVADRTAKSCLLLPGVIRDHTKVGGLAEIASKANGPYQSWYRQTRGLAEYRADRFAAALEWCEKSLEGSPSADARAAARYLLAMALYRQGEVKTAREMLARAVIETPDLEGPQRGATTWHDWLFVHILKREAEALMAPAIAPPPREVKYGRMTLDQNIIDARIERSHFEIFCIRGAENLTMAFSDFTYPEVLTKFGLTAEPAFNLFDQVQSVAPSPELQNRLTLGAPLAVLLNTEKARSEGMISPILIEFWARYRGRVGVYSGNIFDADPAVGLSGYCDFLISRSPQQPYITPPAVVIFEAKRDNIIDGLGQGIAGMIGAQRFNQRHNTLIDPIYGCVTTGSAWKFLQLNGTRITIDLTEYTLAQVDRILGIFAHMVGPIPQPAAA